MIVTAREVKHSAGEDEVGECVWKGHLFYGLHAEIVCGKSRREGCGEAARALNRVRVRIHAEYLIPLPEKVDQVAPGTAARIEHPGHGPEHGLDSDWPTIRLKPDLHVTERRLTGQS
jgi:hypothetical protein